MNVLIRKSPEEEQSFCKNLHGLLSFPRSGSHWTRRMVGEVLGLRYGFSIEFGKSLNKDCGFRPRAINEPDFESRPQLVANHSVKTFKKENLTVFLRRDFEQVWRSTQKAQIEMEDCWWGGTREECFEKWKATTEYGCTYSKLVVDYDMTKADPRATVKAIIEAMGLEPATDEELDAALKAGSRENMLKEQETNCESRTWNIVNKENYDPIKDAGVSAT